MIVGHRRQIGYLTQVLKRGAIAHAYLFIGPEGVGKRSVATGVAAALLCRAPRPPFGGCGACEDCRLALCGAHPDLLALSAEEPLAEGGSAREIGIKSVHELERRLALSSWRGGRKVAIIEQAERLSRDAQSALLKALEDPDDRTVFFLIASSAASLLATIRSRAVILPFAPLGDEELAALVGDVPVRQRRELVSLANGRPGRLARMLSDASLREREAAAARQYADLLNGDLASLFAFSERYSREGGVLEAAFERLLGPLREELHEAMRASGGDERAARLGAVLGLLLDRRRILETTNANRRLVGDSTLFELSLLRAPR